MSGPEPTEGDSSSPSCECKVGRVAKRYEVEDLDRRLDERRDAGASLRDLERFVNRTLLERALRSSSTDVVGDVGSVYDALTGDDASAGERTELRQRLSGGGVDVDGLLAAFVSYQTVRSHLRECLDVDTGRQSPIDPDDGKGTIEWARARSEGVVGRTLDRLARDGAIAAGDLEVTQTIRVTCTRCGVTRTVGAFVDEGGCDCEEGDAS